MRSEIRQLAHQQQHVVHPSEAKYYVLNWPRYVSKHGGSWSGYLRVMMLQDARTLAGGGAKGAQTPDCNLHALRVVPGYRLPPLLADARTMYPVLAHRPRSHHLAPVPVSSCTRYLAAPRGMGHGATSRTRGTAPGFSQQKGACSACLCPEPDSLGNAEGA